jgi:hypothetical protein
MKLVYNLRVRICRRLAKDSLFNILVPIRFSPEIRLIGIPNCLQSCILHLDFSRFSPHSTGNKSDIKRERLALNIYASHMAQVIEKTQIDAILHLDFSRFSPLTDAVTVFITVRASFDRFNLADSTIS